MADRGRAVPRRPSRPWRRRTTNLALLVVLVFTFVSGAAAQATGSQRGAWWGPAAVPADLRGS